MPNGACCSRTSFNQPYTCLDAQDSSCRIGTSDIFYPNLGCEQLQASPTTGGLCGYQACCTPSGCVDVQFEPFGILECENLGGALVPYATGYTTCASDPCGSSITGACCLPDRTCSVRNEALCLSAGGGWHEGETCNTYNCLLPPLGGCRHTQESVAGHETWSLNLCHPMFLSEEYPDADGMYSPISTHTNRAMELNTFGANDSACRWHRGGFAMLPDGYLETFICSVPHYGQADQKQLSSGVVAIMEDGYAEDMASYHAPYWGEAQYHSQPTICGIAE